MSRFRAFGVVLVTVSVVLAAGACSSDSKDATPTSRKALVFGDGPSATKLAVCSAYKIPAMKKVVGGGKHFRVLAPTSIGKKGDPVTGETCSWEQRGSGSKARSLQVEIRDYGKDTAAVAAQFDVLKARTTGAVDVANTGDRSFSSESADATLLQIQSGSHLLTISSRGAGGLDPVPLGTLQFMAGAALAKLT